MKEYSCRNCGKTFTHDSGGKPGRPPVRCEECRVAAQRSKEKAVKVKTSLTTNERVDRLEAMLKSRGLHPSQNLDKYK